MTDRGSVVVTGASTGIGEACARRLDADGWRVFAGVRRAEDAARLREGTARLCPVTLDVTNHDTIAAAVAVVEAAVGADGLGGLVNNAGIAVAGPLEYLPIDRLRRQFDVNVTGQVTVTQALLPMLRRATGRLVFVGSIAGRFAAPMLGPYAASKFAIEAICDSLRVELAPWGLHVSLVEPGDIATPIWDKGLADGDALASSMPGIAQERYAGLIAAVRRVAEHAARHGAPTDLVADAIVHALTASRPRTRYLVGRDARVRAWIARLPDRWRDALLRRLLGLPGRADQQEP